MHPFPAAMMVRGAVLAQVGSTWNPADKDPSITLSNGNRTATGTVADYRGVRNTSSKTSGKYYTEIQLLVAANQGTSGVGVANASAPLERYIGSDANGLVYYASGAVFYDGAQIDTLPTYDEANKIVQIAEDYTARKIWFGVNGVFSGNPAANTGGYSLPTGAQFLGCTIYDTRSFVLNTGQAAFVYTAPSGFSARG